MKALDGSNYVWTKNSNLLDKLVANSARGGSSILTETKCPFNSIHYLFACQVPGWTGWLEGVPWDAGRVQLSGAGVSHTWAKVQIVTSHALVEYADLNDRRNEKFRLIKILSAHTHAFNIKIKSAHNLIPHFMKWADQECLDFFTPALNSYISILALM